MYKTYRNTYIVTAEQQAEIRRGKFARTCDLLSDNVSKSQPIWCFGARRRIWRSSKIPAWNNAGSHFDEQLPQRQSKQLRVIETRKWLQILKKVGQKALLVRTFSHFIACLLSTREASLARRDTLCISVVVYTHVCLHSFSSNA